MSNQENTSIKRDQVWIRKDTGNEHKIMCVVDGYVLVRIKGCYPSVHYIKDFLKNFQLKDGSNNVCD